jgi:hypothetical protein
LNGLLPNVITIPEINLLQLESPRDSRDIGGDAQSGDPGNSKMARSTDHFAMEIRIRFGAHRPGTQKVLELC